MRLEPNTRYNYPNLGNAYMSLNRLDEAEAVFKQAEERKLGSEFLLYSHYMLAFLKGDTARMAELAAGRHGQAGQRRSAAGHASRHGRLVWEAKECKRADSAGDGFSPAQRRQRDCRNLSGSGGAARGGIGLRRAGPDRRRCGS